MADDDDAQFDTVDSGASKTFPMQCSALRKNGFVMLKGRPCKIVDMSTSKTGKHGHAKVHLVGWIFYPEEVRGHLSLDPQHGCAAREARGLPADRYQWWWLRHPDGDNGEIREDLKVPDGELGGALRSDFDDGKDLLLTVLAACGEECVIAMKNNSGLDKGGIWSSRTSISMMDTILIKLWLRNFVDFIGIIFYRIQNILDI